ncbi:hypothetical protein D3C87_125180 [compost metagenome]
MAEVKVKRPDFESMNVIELGCRIPGFMNQGGVDMIVDVYELDGIGYQDDPVAQKYRIQVKEATEYGKWFSYRDDK